MIITGDKNLPALKAAAHDAIDAAGSACHATAAGGVPAAVLALKSAEAAAFLAAYPGGTGAPAVAPATYPFIAAETGLTAATPYLVAHAFAAMATAWHAHAAKIEAARLAAKAAVAAAATPAAVAAAQKVAWPS